MGKFKLTLLSITLCVAALLSGCTPSGNQTGTPAASVTEGVSIGNRAPDFQLQNLDGQTVKLSDYRGKPVLLNFWATWCGPCKFEVPFLNQINTAYTPKGLIMLTVDVGENSTTIRNFMASLNVTLPVVLDSNSAVAKSYSITGIPTTMMLDKDGIIRFKLTGAFQNKAAIETALTTVMP